MTQHAARLATIVRQVSQDPQRSPLFHWLSKHHDRLAAGLTGKRINWPPLIAAAVNAGVKDGFGQDPTERTVRRTWKDVSSLRGAQAAASASEPERKPQPRDLPADWKPTPISVSASVPALASSPAAGVKPSAALVPTPALPPLTHPSQTRVIGQSTLGVNRARFVGGWFH